MSLLTLAAAGLLALVLAYWSWIWFAPRAEPRALGGESRAPQIEAANRLFGGAPRGTPDAVPASIAIELLGVAAATGSQPGYAVFRLASKRAVAVREGEEIEPGVTLAEVRSDRVILERGGVRETLPFPIPPKTKRKGT